MGFGDSGFGDTPPFNPPPSTPAPSPAPVTAPTPPPRPGQCLSVLEIKN